MSRKVGSLVLVLLALILVVGCEQTPQGTYMKPPKEGATTKSGGPAQGTTEP
ncbi:MAG: hypothetical protein JSS65_08155 [Armatimonadetes bacterium]|nr:hypothetical protein [Armatimonadota bacterium]